MSRYHPVKFRHAFLSSCIVLLTGLVTYAVLDYQLSLLGSLGWLSLVFGLVAGVALYGGVFVITGLYFIRVPSIKGLMRKLHDMFRDFSWPSIIVVSFMAGLGEELLIRGVIQTLLIDLLNPTLGIVIASLIFGLMHFLTRAYVLVTFSLGIVFGIGYYLTNSLFFVMVAHAVYDVLAFAILVKFPRLLGVEPVNGLPIQEINN